MSYFRGKSQFGEDDTQNYLIFQPIFRYFKVNTINNATNYVLSWISKGLSDETIKPTATSDNCLTPILNYYNINKTKVKFTGSCLKQSKLKTTHKNVVNIYIVYQLGASSSHNNDPALKNCLFGAVTLTKNADINKYGSSGYGTGFDRRSIFLFPDCGFGQNVLRFGADMSFSTCVDNKKRHISSRNRTNSRIRTYFNCRKNVFS